MMGHEVVYGVDDIGRHFDDEREKLISDKSHDLKYKELKRMLLHLSSSFCKKDRD